MVASPRNHLYRTPIGTNFPAFRATGKLDHVGDLPHEFDRKAALSGTDGDTLDKTAQDLDPLRSPPIGSPDQREPAGDYRLSFDRLCWDEVAEPPLAHSQSQTRA